MRAALLISHGSKASQSRKEIEALANRLERESRILIEIAFLEIDQPDIPLGIQNCIQKGADDIVVLLNFLNEGVHVAQDIPALIQTARKQYPGVTFTVMPHLSRHPKFDALFLDMIHQPTHSQNR